jgi:hypothetical protein
MTEEQAIRNRVTNAKCGGYPRVSGTTYQQDVCELLRLLDEARAALAMAEARRERGEG